MRKIRWAVLLVSLLAAIGPSFAQGTEVSGPPLGEVLASMPEITPISVSFSGTDAEAFRREFMRLAEQQGQPVSVADWGGKYLVLLRGEMENNAIAGDVWRMLGSRTRLASGLRGVATWRLTADVKAGSQHLFSESAKATGPRTNFNAYNWSSSGGFDASVFNNWLDRSLQGKTVRELVPRIMRRLQLLEQPAAQVPQPLTGPVHSENQRPPAEYLLFPLNRNPIRVTVNSGKSPNPGDSMVFYNRQGGRIAKYIVLALEGENIQVKAIFERVIPRPGDPFDIIRP